MTSEKIIISFDDEDKTEKIPIPEEKSFDIPEVVNNIAEYFPFGNNGINKFFESTLTFPEGTDKGFSTKFSLELKNDIFSPPLMYKKYLLITTSKERVYLIDRLSGNIENSFTIRNESFETGGVINNFASYIPTLKKIFLLDNFENGMIKLCDSDENYYIWSNIICFGNNLLFIEYSPEKNNCKICLYGIPGKAKNTLFEFDCEEPNSQIAFNNGKLCINDLRTIYIFDLMSNTLNKIKHSEHISEKIIINNNLIYYNINGEVFDYNLLTNTTRFTGIKIENPNSIAGYNDNLFFGSLNGWYAFKTNGVNLFTYSDTEENKVEALSKNILAVSKKNKIVFHNLNNFAEAEGFSVTDKDSDYITSVAFCDNRIYVLSKNGEVLSFSNDRLIINV